MMNIKEDNENDKKQVWIQKMKKIIVVHNE